ncbi:MAG: cupin domain-containing protein [Verrucomicrobiota bacterium]|nr:cupin domain-containing protein [Verrucomicrobiota bacterium]
MRKINLTEIKEEERRSPTGKFHAYFKQISVALGRDPKSSDRLRQHPFDLSSYRLPAGASRCPYHVHSAESELYLIVSGRALVRDANGNTIAEAGDTFFFPPGEAHEIRNPGPDDLIYYVIADNTVGECCYYPDSDKWMVNDGVNEQVIKGGAAVEYYSGEDPGS